LRLSSSPSSILIFYSFYIGIAGAVVKLATVGSWELEFDVMNGIRFVWKGFKEGLEGGVRAWG
jgi:hypothetical protein